MCRVSTGPNRFHSNRKRYEKEFDSYLRAEAAWKNHTVALRLVPQLCGTKKSQTEAFPPETKPPIYPTCFDSASAGNFNCKALKELYTDVSDDFVTRAIAEVLSVVPGSGHVTPAA